MRKTIDWNSVSSRAVRKGISVIGLVALAIVAQADPQVLIDWKAPTKPRSKMATFSVGSDRALIFLRDEHQRDLLTLQKAIGFRYLRCHGLFNEEMKIVRRNPDGSLSFDWTRVDKFIDQLHAAHLKPFFELGFIPEALASGKQTIFYWRGNVTPPAKITEWQQLVSEFARHIIARYGLREARSCYYEVWNEPNLDGFWTGGKDGYFSLYAATAKALKSVDSGLRVGGPSTAGLAWIPDFVAYCKTNVIPLDFISSHAYAAMQGFLDENGHGGGTVLDTSPETLINGFRPSRADTPSKLPLFISEWGPSYSPRDPIHDSYVCAPFILDKVRLSEGLVDGLSYWAFSDQFEEPGPPHTPFHGGFGLLNVDGLRKPAFFAYEMLAKLYDREVKVDQPRVIATKQGKNLRIVLWDYSPFKQDAPNEPFYHRDLKPTELPPVNLEFKNLPNGTYHVKWWGTGYMRNDVYGFYSKMQGTKPDGAHLPASVLQSLEAKYQSPESLPDVVVTDGHTTLALPMRTNDTWYVEISRK